MENVILTKSNKLLQISSLIYFYLPSFSFVCCLSVTHLLPLFNLVTNKNKDGGCFKG